MLSRFRRGDDGSVAVLAGVTFPLVLLCVALAVAAMVWTSSEHEAQRAADAAAVRAAATAFLGTDFPYEAIPGLTEPVTYPDIAAIAAAAGLDAPGNLDECGTVGLPPGPDIYNDDLPGVEVTVETELSDRLNLPADCEPVGPFAPPPPLGLPDQSRNVACQTARDAMAPADAPFANKFYKGEGDAQPSCADRVSVKLATGSPLVGFGATASDAVTGALETRLVPQMGTLRAVLAAFGIRLDTSLPSLICPEIGVGIDQPVREPIFDRASAPNGRATARRVVKNAVVVPVYNGHTIQAATDGEVVASAAGAGVSMTTSAGAVLNIPPQNINAVLIAAQAQLLTLLDEVDAIADAAIKASGITLDQLNGVYQGIDPEEEQPSPVPGVEPLDGLRLTKCLRDSLTQIYDPPSGDAPTAEEVLKDAARTGEQVVVAQVGVVEAECTEPGAIPLDVDVPGEESPLPGEIGTTEVTLTPECIRAATVPQVDPLTGIYEVPFFDATPVLVQDVGDGNFEAVPVHASQASGAFRAALVRDAADERWDPDVRQPVPTPACDLTVPLPTPATACQILDVTPDPLPTLPSPTLPVEPPLPPEESSSPTPEPTESPTPTPSPTCTLPPLLCGVGP